MKMLPGMTVIVPCDYNQTKLATMAVAEYFRDQGLHVLLLADSVTRFAEAHRREVDRSRVPAPVTLCAQHGFIEQVLAHLQSGAITIDAGGRVTRFNRRAEQILDVSLGDVLGHQK